MIKAWIKWLFIKDGRSAESPEVAEQLEAKRRENPGRPYCPAWQGDLMSRLLRVHALADCLETGFGTGSTAFYMLSNTRDRDGRVLSIDWSESNFNALGRALLAENGVEDRHELIERPSFGVMAELLTQGRAFDFAFIDGWKTFDYLAYEMFILNRLLRNGGFVMFDDAYLPSVRKTIRLMKTHFGFKEIRYRDYGETWRLRLWLAIAYRRFCRPYRVLRKAVAVPDQPATRDWVFFRRF